MRRKPSCLGATGFNYSQYLSFYHQRGYLYCIYLCSQCSIGSHKYPSSNMAHDSESAASRPLTDYSKDRAQAASPEPKTNQERTYHHRRDTKNTASSEQAALSTVEYLLSLPMDNPMQEPYYPDELQSTSAAPEDSCSTAMDGSIALEDLDASITLSYLDNIASSRSTCQDRRRAFSEDSSSVSFCMRRSSRNLGRSKSFDDSISSSDRLQKSLSHSVKEGTLKDESMVHKKARSAIFGRQNNRSANCLSRSFTFNDSTSTSTMHRSSSSRHLFGGTGSYRRPSSRRDLPLTAELEGASWILETSKSQLRNTEEPAMQCKLERMQKRTGALTNASSRPTYHRSKPPKELQEHGTTRRVTIRRRDSPSSFRSNSTKSHYDSTGAWGNASSRQSLMRSCNQIDTCNFVTSSRIRRVYSQAA